MVGTIYSRRDWDCAGALDAVDAFYIFAILAIEARIASSKRKIQV